MTSKHSAHNNSSSWKASFASFAHVHIPCFGLNTWEMGWVWRETRTVNSYNVFVGVQSKLTLFPNYFECLPIHIICRRSKFRTISYNFSAHITIKGHETFLFYLQIQRSEPTRRDRHKERLSRAYWKLFSVCCYRARHGVLVTRLLILSTFTQLELLLYKLINVRRVRKLKFNILKNY